MVKLLPDRDEINSSASFSFSNLFILSDPLSALLAPQGNRNLNLSPELGLALLIFSETVIGKFIIAEFGELDPYPSSLAILPVSNL